MWRIIAWLALAGLLLYQTGSPAEDTPWSQLEAGFNRLGSGEINYQCYCFSAGDKLDAGRLRWPAENRPRENQVRLLKMDSGIDMPEGQEVWILNITGSDRRACWKALQQHFPQNAAGSPVAWMAELSVEGAVTDLPVLAEKLLSELTGEPCNVYRDEFTINIMAYAPQFKPELIMNGVPVNLNLELRYNRNLEKIRIRAGVPLLISDLRV